MARDPKFVLEYLKQIEAIASEILNDRRDIIELNKKRDKTREASRALKSKSTQQSEPKKQSNATLCCGNLFISSFSEEQVLALLDKDFKKYTDEIDRLHRGLKAKVNKLYDAENRPELKGYDLAPFTREERESLNELTK